MSNPAPHTFKVGDKATHTIYTDSRAGYITHVSPNGKTVLFVEAEATLLNGPKSGEPDALGFSPGGFCGHTSGTQRWQIGDKPIEGRKSIKFSLRGNGRWKIAGGSATSPGDVLRPGHSHHYDYNF